MGVTQLERLISKRRIGCIDLPVDSIIWRSRMEKDFIDEFISSKDTRAYLHSIHHEFTDLEKATIVANHIMILYEKR